ncbi:MAG TPA: cobalamin biosynthesis protein CobD [Microscillaceae bacterium]|nr:cobalamin biosynthesis protein CobD [Microscillaceae bacterium]
MNELEIFLWSIAPLTIGYLMDFLLGDPRNLPHPIRLFGWLISQGEKLLNKPTHRFWKGAGLTLGLVTGVFCFFWGMIHLLKSIHPALALVFEVVFVFFGLANKSLIQEGKAVFEKLQNQGLEAGRKRLSWIVGRDTSQLSPSQIRIAVFETMSENLSDGVIAPLFYYAIGGVPGLMAYKMINTLDSMVGYRSERFEQFGKFAAKLDDVANFIPARLTALLLALVSGSQQAFRFILQYGHQHKSPNAGYPEAALAGILDCRFGGPNMYHGKRVEKPYIGQNERNITHQEFGKVAGLNHQVTLCMVFGIIVVTYLRWIA